MDTKNRFAASNLSTEKRELLAYLLEEEGIEGTQPQTIPRRANPDELPLSFAQERLWVLNQLEPYSAAYNEPMAVRLTGVLNMTAFEQSINEIVRRHEVLRTVFQAIEGKPVQVIRDTVTLSLPVVALQELPENEQEVQLHKLALEEFQQLFDLTKGPLLRAKLLRLSKEEHVFLLTMHHTISDGWSVGVFFQELAVLYDAFSTGKPSPLPDPPIQYADFAQWQRLSLQSEDFKTHLAYWKQQLGGNLPVLELPTDHPRPPLQTFKGARYYLTLPMSLSIALKALSHREGVTVFMTLLAAFQTLLHRYTGQEDILVGSPIAGRNWPEVERLVGCFLNTLIMRTDLSSNPSFRELLGRIREVALGAYTHQELPFELLVEELQPERELSRNPLFQVMFVLQNVLTLDIAGLSVSPLQLDRGAAPLDVVLSLQETAQGLTGWWEYNTDLFDATTIMRMAGHFQTLLEGIVANPEQRLSDLPLLTEAERYQLLVEWNDTWADYPKGVCIHQLFESQVERIPDTVAVVYQDQQLTYLELNRRANQLAHHLQALGVGPEILVGIYVERSLEMLVGVLGILKTGGAYVPLDPAYPQERLAFMLEDTQAPVLVTQEQLVKSLPEHRARVVCLDSGRETLAAESKENPVSDVTPKNLAYVIYTSGSTGKPKGVQVPHRGVVNLLHDVREQPGLTAQDTLLSVTTLSFDIVVSELFLPLSVGARLVIVSHEVASDGTKLLTALTTSGATFLQPTPATWRLLLEAGWEGSSQLKIISTGEALSRELADKLLLKGAALWNLYGPTETTIWSAAYRVDAEEGVVPIGRPVANTQLYILDAHLHPVPIGVPGGLYIGGDGLTKGYLNRPELTDEKFIPNPFCDEPGSRLYITGDLARYLPDGNIECLGRLDHQVKIRGFRIELEEIESVLVQHPAVRETVVMAREDSPGDKRLVAYVVVDEEQKPNISAWRSFLQEKLPEYMMPAAWVVLESLPLTPNGKINRLALPAPDSGRPELERTFVAPRDVLEFRLAQTWERVLGIEPIGVQDNFFELGGHSLLAVRLLAHLEEIAHKKLPLVTLFQAPTIEQLANVLRQEEWVAPWSSLVAIHPAGSKPPLFGLHAAAGNVLFYSDLARHLGTDQPFYGLQAQGLDGDKLPHTRVEEMATHYIKEIRTVQPQGPYFLGGLSFGGTVAFEIARQLSTQDQKVALLVMFDTYGPGYPKISGIRLCRDKVLRFAPRVYNNALDFMRLRPREQMAFALEKVGNISRRTNARLKQRIHKTKVWFQTLAYKLHMRVGRPLPPTLRYIHVREADHKAHREYVPQVYPGKITLFRASKQPPGAYPDPYLGWGDLAAGGIETYKIPGSHSHTLIREPKVQIVVEKLKVCLAEAQETE